METVDSNTNPAADAAEPVVEEGSELRAGAVVRTVSPRVRCMTLQQVMEATHFAKSTLYQEIAEGSFPRPFKAGRKSVWLEASVIKNLADRERRAQKTHAQRSA